MSQYECPICGVVITSKKTNFSRHMKLHEEQERLVCQSCKRSYQNRGNFKIHLDRHHKEEDLDLITYIMSKTTT